MTIFQKSKTTAYAKLQAAKGSAETVAAANAVDLLLESPMVQPRGEQIDRGLIRDKRFPSKQVAGGRWGEGSVNLELRGSGSAGTAPEFGPLLETLLGSEQVVTADTVEAGSGAAAGFDASEEWPVGTVVRIDVNGDGSVYDVRKIDTVSGSGPFSYTVHRAFSSTPADGADILAGVTYYHGGSEAEQYFTFEQYLDGLKLLCTDTVCESLQFTTTAREVIQGVFGLRALTCAESAAADALTPVFDDSDPLIGTECNLVLAGSALDMQSFDFSLSTRRARGGINSTGYADLPWMSKFEATGTLTPWVEDEAPITTFFAGTLADLEMVKGDTAGNIMAIILEDVQYTGQEIGDEDGDFSWNLPFVITGGAYIAFF